MSVFRWVFPNVLTSLSSSLYHRPHHFLLLLCVKILIRIRKLKQWSWQRDAFLCPHHQHQRHHHLHNPHFFRISANNGEGWGEPGPAWNFATKGAGGVAGKTFFLAIIMLILILVMKSHSNQFTIKHLQNPRWKLELESSQAQPFSSAVPSPQSFSSWWGCKIRLLVKRMWNASWKS